MLTIILSHERSGSHLLGEALNSFENVVVYDEVCNSHAMDSGQFNSSISFHRFHDRWAREHEDFLGRPTYQSKLEFGKNYFLNLSKVAAGRNAVVDIKYGHIHNFEWFWCPIFKRPLLFTVCENLDIRLIHLYRKNILEAATSAHVAQARKLWHSWEQNAEQLMKQRHKLDVHLIVNDALLLDKQTRWIKDRWIGNIPCFELTYERLSQEISSPDRLLSELAKFVGGEHTAGFKPELKKLGRPLVEIVDNYEELVAACRGTPVEQFIAD